MTIESVVMVVSLVGLFVSWDIARRYFTVKRLSLDVQDRLATHDRELERLHAQVQGLMSRLSTTTAATATRMPVRNVR